MRTAPRTLRVSASAHETPRASRHSSRTRSTPPNARNAAVRASAGLMPARARRSVSSSTWSCSSRSSCPSSRWPVRRARNRRIRRVHIGGLLTGAAGASCFPFEHARHGERHALPLSLFFLELPLALPREAVKLRLAVVLRAAPLGVNPAGFFEPVERRIERPLVDAQDVPRNLLNTL